MGTRVPAPTVPTSPAKARSPHPACLYPDGLEYMADAIAQMTEEERFKVFSGNAAKVYNIDIG